MFRKMLLLSSAILVLSGCSQPKPTPMVDGGVEEKVVIDYDNVKVIDTAEGADELLDRDGVTYIYVVKDGCKYCDMVEPAVVDAIGVNPEVEFHYLNITEFTPSKEFSEHIGLKQVPWLIRLVDGELDSTYLFDENTKSHELSLWIRDLGGL